MFLFFFKYVNAFDLLFLFEAHKELQKSLALIALENNIKSFYRITLITMFFPIPVLQVPKKTFQDSWRLYIWDAMRCNKIESNKIDLPIHYK